MVHTTSNDRSSQGKVLSFARGARETRVRERIQRNIKEAYPLVLPIIERELGAVQYLITEGDNHQACKMLDNAGIDMLVRRHNRLLFGVALRMHYSEAGYVNLDFSIRYSQWEGLVNGFTQSGHALRPEWIVEASLCGNPWQTRRIAFIRVVDLYRYIALNPLKYCDRIIEGDRFYIVPQAEVIHRYRDSGARALAGSQLEQKYSAAAQKAA